MRQRIRVQSFLLVALIVASVLTCRVLASELATAELTLRGEAKGGTLCLGVNGPPMVTFVSVQTQPGESGQSVARRLGAEARKHFKLLQANSSDIVREVRGDTIVLAGSFLPDFFLAGTETGFGIPKPVASATCNYDKSTGIARVLWENREEDYDIVFRSLQFVYGGQSHVVRAENSETSFTCYITEDEHFRGFWVTLLVFSNEKVPSNVTAVVCPSTGVQEELFAIPFWSGIAPNWTAWQSKDSRDNVVLAEGIKESLSDLAQAAKIWNEEPLPRNKRYYQSIKAKDDGVGGVYRKFLGLTPGRSYRITTRMNTFEMDKAEGDWSFTFHAAGHAADATLTPEQMAGTAPLPDGASGPKAGLVAAFGPETTTQGKWQSVSTEDNADNALQGDLTLAPGMETITVWFRHTAKASTGVGTDWIRLEDLGPASKEPAESSD